VAVAQPARDEGGRVHRELPVLIEEDIRACIERGLLFAGWTLDRIDPVRRLSDVAVVTALLGGSYLGWRTRTEHERSPSSGVVGMGGSEQTVVKLSPARRNRAALTHDVTRMAEDLTVLLRREVRS
jgi:hypothetical protein